MTDAPATVGMPFGSAANPRLGHRRDAASVAQLVADPRARLFVMTADDQIPLEGERIAWRPIPDGVDLASLVLLGDVDGVASFALDVGADSVRGGVAVRPALDLLGETEGAALLHATGVITWHRRHRYCASCGASTEPRAAGHERWCPSCGTTHFPRTDPVVIMLVTNRDACVLGQRRGAPDGRWSTLAGFVEPGESLEDAVAREVFEEVGLEVDGVTYVGSQPWPFPSALMAAFEASAPRRPLVGNDEHVQVRWFEREELRAAMASGAAFVPSAIVAGGHLIRRWLG
jgi:NAD+ diphosphatase